MPAWLLWLIVAGLLAAAEAVSGDFVLIMIAGGAAGGAVAAAVGLPAVGQIAVGIAAAAGLLLFLRPVLRRHLAATAHPMGIEALIGSEAVALGPVDAHGGRVRLNGSEWSARCFDRDQVITAGTRVRVVQISGATAVVWADIPSPLP